MIAGLLEPDGGEMTRRRQGLSSPRSVVPPERPQYEHDFQSYAIWRI